MTFVRSGWARAAFVVAAAAGVIALLWWRGPAWSAVGDAFTAVEWHWVAASVGLNLLSVLVRAMAWRTIIVQAFAEGPRPNFMLVFSAFCVGLFANAVLPGRIGELARVAVLTRRMRRRAAWARLLGTVFAHRVFDLVAVIGLVVYVMLTAHVPDWAVTSLIVVVIVGVILFTVAVMGARSDHFAGVEDGLGAVRKVVRLARYGLSVMRRPAAAALALVFQLLGWTCQLFAVYTAMRAFGIHEPLPAAGLVLVLMNVATIFPLWPGNVGLVQAAVALPLFTYYGVAKARGIAFGFGLQAIEASVGIGVGLIFLAREGLSVAMLRVMPDASKAEPPGAEAHAETTPSEEDAAQPRARMSG
ncbi:MAG TPA: lysylphosphatidylglycerol synthase transmembrane domain-containing protein [Gaiellaceae bacterium]|nr:lysylphosphatidylglycerol synthase transmembrane domain-containing protein [Gaiellaceae bacterium]